MIKYLAKFEAVVEGRVGHFLVDHDLDITLAEKMANQFLAYIQQLKANVQKPPETQNPQPMEQAPDGN